MADELYLRVADLLEREPDHAGAHHILGRLHAAGMRMGGLERFLARTLLGADLLGDLSWSDARIHLERAERLDPCVPDHHYELAKLYSERGDARAALEEIEHVLVLGAQAPVPTDVLDKTASLRDLLASR